VALLRPLSARSKILRNVLSIFPVYLSAAWLGRAFFSFGVADIQIGS